MPATLYDTDFSAWASQQARLLTSGKTDALDLEHLAEEIHDMGNEQAFALESALRQALVHLLKLSVSTAEDPRAKWKSSVAKQRIEIEARLKRNPSLKSKVDELFTDAWQAARQLAKAELDAYGEQPTIPEVNPFSLDQVRSQEFSPVPIRNKAAKP